jgi:hypothetical protein
MKSDDMIMVQKYWVSGLCSLSGILNTRNTTFHKLDVSVLR